MRFASRTLHLPFTQRAVLLVLLVAVAVGSASSLFRPGVSQAATPDAGMPLFGVTFGTVPSANAAALSGDVKAGFANVHIAWSELEPAPGVRDAAAEARVDALIGGLSSRGIKVVAAVASAPAWAGLNPNGPLLPGKDADYLQFLERMVRKYGAAPYNVRHWMMFSEPDAISYPGSATGCRNCLSAAGRGAWGDYPAEYAALLRQAYAKVKEVDPSGYLLMGPLAFDFFYSADATYPGFNGGGYFRYEFLDSVLRALAASGGGQPFDALAVNAYIVFGPGWEADAARNGRRGIGVAAKISHVRSILDRHGVSAPILIGEAGFWSRGARVAPTDGLGNVFPNAWIEPSERTQAEYVAKMYARARDAGVAGVAWFTLEEQQSSDADYGLVGANGLKEAGRAYQWASTALSGAERRASPAGYGVVGSGAVEAYGFTSGSQYTLVAWAKPTQGMSAAEATAPTAQVAVWSGFRAYDLFGTEVSPSSTDAQGRPVYSLTTSPLFFRLSGPLHSVFVPLSPRNGAG